MNIIYTFLTQLGVRRVSEHYCRKMLLSAPMSDTLLGIKNLLARMGVPTRGVRYEDLTQNPQFPSIVHIGTSFEVASEENWEKAENAIIEACKEKGINAVYTAMRLIQRFCALPPVEQDGMYGKGILELTDIQSAPYPGKSVVPHYCKATFDRRLLVGETRESVLAPLQAVIDELSAADPSVKARVSFAAGQETCYTGAVIAADRFFPAWKAETDAPYIQAIYKAVRDMGYTPELTGYSFCTNGSHYGGEAGIPCIGIGPGREDLAHTVDEYIEISELIDICRYDIAVCNAMMAPTVPVDVE